MPAIPLSRVGGFYSSGHYFQPANDSVSAPIPFSKVEAPFSAMAGFGAEFRLITLDAQGNGAPMPFLNQTLLNSYHHKHISEICLNHFDGNDRNHCAHFVGHVLQLSHGKTCHRMVHRSHRVMGGGSILVSDLFDITPNPHELLESPTTGQGLIYVSAPGTFEQIGSDTFRMRTVRKRHVGMLLNGSVWHYKNSQNRVVSQPVSEFLRHYRRQRNALWVGELPVSSRPVPFGQCH